MKYLAVILVLFVVIFCIDAKQPCPKCRSDNCGDCTSGKKQGECVWCDGRCISKFLKIGCESRIENSESCPSGDFNACIAALCPINTICEEDEDGNAVCIPIDPCATVRCANGPCVVVDGEAVCQNNDDICARTDCADGLICIVNDGEAECVENPCRLAKCSAGYRCQPDSDGQGSTCVKTNPCTDENGEEHQDGDSWLSDDGCNTCFCADGAIACTLMFCGGDNECTTDDDCGHGFCDYSTCNQESGFCSEPIDACAAIYEPVCGCDGRTYGNNCERSSAGVSLLHFGECAVCDPPCKDGEEFCCPGCLGTTFCSDSSHGECPMLKCAS